MNKPVQILRYIRMNTPRVSVKTVLISSESFFCRAPRTPTQRWAVCINRRGRLDAMCVRWPEPGARKTLVCGGPNVSIFAFRF